MTTYADHIAAHPDCLAQTPEEMAVESALAMGWEEHEDDTQAPFHVCWQSASTEE